MSDVRCTGGKCRGADHVPGCEKYAAAMRLFEEQRKVGRDRTRDKRLRHTRLPAEMLMTPEEAGQARRAGGGGRPLGSTNVLPQGAIEALKILKFRVAPGMPEAAAELAGDALEQTIKVMHGKVPARRAPAALKAAIRVRDEICDPVVQKSEVNANVSMTNVVVAAQKLIAERKAGKK